MKPNKTKFFLQYTYTQVDNPYFFVLNTPEIISSVKQNLYITNEDLLSDAELQLRAGLEPSFIFQRQRVK